MLPVCAVEHESQGDGNMWGLTVAPQVAFGTLRECDYCSERPSPEVTVGVSSLGTAVVSFHHMGSGVNRFCAQHVTHSAISVAWLS